MEGNVMKGLEEEEDIFQLGALDDYTHDHNFLEDLCINISRLSRTPILLSLVPKFIKRRKYKFGIVWSG